MTVSSTTNRISYAGSGTSSFSFPYYIQQFSDLGVALQDTVTGAITPLAYLTDYTLSGTAVANFGYTSGVTVTTNVAVAAGTNIVLFRSSSPTQGTSLPESGPFPSRSVEASMDEIALSQQRALDLSSRALRLADGYTEAFAMTLPEDMFLNPGAVFAVNSTGDGIAYGPSAAALTTAVAAAEAAAAASASSASTSQSYANSISGAITTKGDLVIGSVSGAASRLPIGTSTQVLTVSGGTAVWASPVTGFSNPMTTAGDIITGGASGVAQRLAAGTDTYVLTMTSGAPAWAANAGGAQFTSVAAGIVPASGGGTTNYLRADGTWHAPAGGAGTVTSVDMTVPTGLAVSGNPITSSGTLAVTWSGQIPQANGGTGLSTTASTGVLKYAAGVASVATVNLATDTAATALPLNKGGTGTAAGSANAAFNALSPFTAAGDLLYANAIPTAAALAIGSSGKALVVSGGLPAWGTVGIAAGGTGQITKAAAFDALSPAATKGDIAVYSTTGVAHGVPADGGVMIADSSQTDGWRNTTYTQTQGKPIKNYIQYADFENGATTGWSLGTTGTLTNAIPTGTPAFGSGASGNLSMAIVSSAQLSGAKSLSLVSSAATTAGNMLATSAYPIDLSDQAKVLAIKFNYSVFSGAANVNMSGTSSNSYGVAAWDVTNSVWLPVIGNFNLVQSTGVGQYTGTVQTGATTASIRLVIYNANATAGAATLYLDDFYVGPQSIASGAAMTDWASYTPTVTYFTGGATNVTHVGKWRRVGDSIELEVVSTFSAASAAFSRPIYSLPSGLTFDTAKLGAGAQFQLIGEVECSDTGANDFIGGAGYSSSNTFYGFAQLASGTYASFQDINAGVPFTFGSTDFIKMKIRAPITGWSSNTAQSSDSDQRLVSARVKAITNLAYTSASPILVFTSVEYDSHGAYNASTGAYTVPVTGTYDVAGGFYLTGASFAGGNMSALEVFKNGTLYAHVAASRASAAINPFNNIAYGKTEMQLVAGDVITFRGYSDVSVNTDTTGAFQLAGNYATISRKAGPAVVQQSESVNARYYASSTTISGSLATVVWTTKDYDSHNAMSSGVYTAPVSGKYRVSSLVSSTATHVLNSISDIVIQKNGVTVSESAQYAGGATTGFANLISDTINCLTGDTIRIQYADTGTSPTIVSSNTKNYISIERVGN